MLDGLFTPINLAIAMGIIAVLTGVRRAFPELRKMGWWRRLLPLMPFIMGVLVAFALHFFTEMTNEECVVAGMVGGFAAPSIRNVYKKSIRGQYKKEESDTTAEMDNAEAEDNAEGEI